MLAACRISERHSMNVIVLKLAGALVGLFIAVCTVHQFYLFFKRPLKFWRSKHDDGGDGAWHPYKLHLVPFWGLVFGVGICIFHGTRFILSWMPRSWQWEDVWAPTVIAGFAALFGAFALVHGMETLNSDLIRGSLTRESILEDEKKRAENSGSVR